MQAARQALQQRAGLADVAVIAEAGAVEADAVAGAVECASLTERVEDTTCVARPARLADARGACG